MEFGGDREHRRVQVHAGEGAARGDPVGGLPADDAGTAGNIEDRVSWAHVGGVEKHRRPDAKNGRYELSFIQPSRLVADGKGLVGSVGDAPRVGRVLSLR